MLRARPLSRASAGRFISAGGGSNNNQLDLVSNGAFASDTIWTKNNWTIGSGVATTDNAAASSITQSIGIQPGERYMVIFTVTDFTDGTVTPVLGGTSGTARGATGTFAEVIKAGSTNTLIAFSADLNASLSIDNVSVRTA